MRCETPIVIVTKDYDDPIGDKQGKFQVQSTIVSRRKGRKPVFFVLNRCAARAAAEDWVPYPRSNAMEISDHCGRCGDHVTCEVTPLK